MIIRSVRLTSARTFILARSLSRENAPARVALMRKTAFLPVETRKVEPKKSCFGTFSMPSLFFFLRIFYTIDNICAFAR